MGLACRRLDKRRWETQHFMWLVARASGAHHSESGIAHPNHPEAPVVAQRVQASQADQMAQSSGIAAEPLSALQTPPHALNTLAGPGAYVSSTSSETEPGDEEPQEQSAHLASSRCVICLMHCCCQAGAWPHCMYFIPDLPDCAL